MACSGRLLIDFQIRELLTPSVAGNGVWVHNLQRALDLAAGTADGQIDKVYSVVEAGLGAAVTTAYDLAGTTLKDRNGASISFAEVTFLILVNLSTTAANVLQMGPAASNGFGALATNKGFWADASDRSIAMGDGESMVFLTSKTGVPVVAATGDILNVITASATSLNTYLLIIAGRSA